MIAIVNLLNDVSMLNRASFNKFIIATFKEVIDTENGRENLQVLEDFSACVLAHGAR